jgi:glycosyltransferase involved in cell wall biosynthesis
MPKISVCSATYNHEKYITQAVQSVLDQTCGDFELIITDDASSDGNVEKLMQFSDPRIMVLRHERNRGNMATSNTSYAQSSGNYVVSLTTDDVWEPRMLELLSDTLDKNAELLGVFGQATYIDEHGDEIDVGSSSVGVGLTRYQYLNRLFCGLNDFICPTAMIRRSCFDALGYFPRYLRQIHDLAFWIRMLFKGDLLILPDTVLKFRLRDHNLNAGSDTPANRRRANFEFYQTLRSFGENITDIQVLLSIFPEIEKHPWPLENKLVKFHLAQVALTKKSSAHRLLALDLLYECMTDMSTAEYLRTNCDFDYPALFDLEAEAPLFAYDMDGAGNDRSELELSRLLEESSRLRKHLEIYFRDLSSGNYSGSRTAITSMM